MEPLLLGLGITLLPVYSFKSGTVQYAHIILAFFMLMRFSHQHTKFTKLEVFLALLALLSLFVESIAVMSGASVSSLLEPAYLIFNAAIVITFMRIPMNDRHFRFALIGSLIASTLIATVSVWYFGASLTVLQSGFERSSGLFNNANQQGYFAVCVASIAGLLYLRDSLSRNMTMLLWALSLILVMTSVSRASSVAIGAMLVFGFASFLNKDRLSPMVMVGAVVLMAGVWAAYSFGELNSLQFVQRIKDTGASSYDSFAARGYVIPFHDPISFLFGVGAEKAKVGTIFYRIEVHSTWWSFMGKYGIVGFSLYVGAWLIWTRRLYSERGLLALLIVILPSIITGVTANYSRFTPLYILIGLSLNTTRNAFRERMQATPSTRPLNILSESSRLAAGALGASGSGAGPSPSPAPKM